MKKYKRILVGILMAMVLMALPAMPAMAATTDNVIVTATPAYITIGNSPGSWTINDIVGDGVTPKGTIGVNTQYHSNPLGDATQPSDPVVDGECQFTISNNSTIATNIVVNFPNHAGGDASTNSDTGANGATSFGAYTYASGDNWTTEKVVCKASDSENMTAGLAADADIKWGISYESQSDAWTSGDSMTSTVTITATAA